MPLVFNTITMSSVYFNGVEMDYVYFNGVLIHQVTTQTATPNIHTYSYNAKFWSIHWYVQNMDGASAEIWSELGDTTPDVSRGTISSGSSTSLISQSTFGGATIYAKAQASGKTLSNYDSQYVSA